MRPLFIRLVIGAIWLLAVGAGLAVVMKYESVPGATGMTPTTWPKQLAEPRDVTQPTLIMFAHPKCPCTRASLNELSRLLARCENRPAAHIYFLKPEGQTDDWVRSDLWHRADAIPGLILHEDEGGRMAESFGAQTSGYVVLYDARGQLLFHGGITAARGQSGDNLGENQLLTWLSGQTPDVVNKTPLPVFGCALQTRCDESAN